MRFDNVTKNLVEFYYLEIIHLYIFFYFCHHLL
nr:MAG TPA: hypothetical protein [Bacteriophage sp.]